MSKEGRHRRWVAFTTMPPCQRVSCMQAALSQRCLDVIRHAERRRAYKGVLTIVRAPVSADEAAAWTEEAPMVGDRGQQGSRRRKR